jgi:enamine deaminase RidA (YjgF/YER057c/UK114 family)
MVDIVTTSGGGRFERIGSYSRAKRVGPFVYVAGTTAIEPSGKLHAPYDTYAQTVYAFERVAKALVEVGSSLRDVVRTRMYFADISSAGDAVRAHGEVFRGIDPVTTGCEVGLTTPGMMVEVEVDAIIASMLGAPPA